MIKRAVTRKSQKPPPVQITNRIEDSDDEGGFSKWLKTSEGAKLMWYFIVGNSTVVFLTMTWPRIQQVADIIIDLFKN